jgi:UDP-GlcNAc:undecaprenyl-phosphate GlcNAc-1-phosphate transferase
MIDAPGERKIHADAVPRSGGLGIAGTFFGVLIFNLIATWILSQKPGLLPDNIQAYINNIPSILHHLSGLVIASIIVFILGVYDDRRPLSPKVKLGVQGVAAALLVFSGIRINLFLDIPIIEAVVTIFWVVLICNSFNLLDNMNGLTSGVAVIIALILAWIAWDSGDYFMVCIFRVLIGAMLGFWYFNFWGGRIFLGDGGSLFIGFLLAALSILSTYYRKGDPTQLPVLIPLIVMGVPVFDTVSVMWIRFRRGKPLFVGDTNHFSHRLVALGMNRRGAVVFIYLVTFVVGLNAIQLKYLPLRPALVTTGQTALIFLMIYLLERAIRKK